MNYSYSSNSIAHTYGNITALITDYIKNLFEKEYFSTINISSSIAYRQFNIFQNKNKEFFKKSKPMLIVRPRIEMDDNEVFLNGTYLTNRIVDTYMERDFSNLQPFIKDKNRNIEMKYLLNRLKIFFDVSIINETQMEQINVAHFLKNRIRHGRYMFIKACLENHIPREFMDIIAQHSGIPMFDENGSVKSFLDYINGISDYPISYKMKNSTGNDEFFRFYPVNIDTVFSSISIDDGSKKGFISDSYTTSFTISAEFNAVGLYYLFSEQDINIDEVRGFITESDKKALIPLFTYSNVYNMRFPDGWDLYASSIFSVETNTVDELEFMSLFTGPMQDIIKYHVDNGLPIDTFIGVRIMKDGEFLNYATGDLSTDFKTMKATIYRCNPVSTYRIFIIVNNLYINTNAKDYLELDEEK